MTKGLRKALTSVKKGVLTMPVRVLIYGGEKVGKSTFAAGAPAPIFIGADQGTVNLDVARIEPSSWDEALGFVSEIGSDAHDYKSIVLDPTNWLEPLCWAKVIEIEGKGSSSIEEVGGGYKKGYTAALDQWRILLLALERCWRRGMNVILTAHSQVKNFANPEGPAFDRFELAMNPQAAGVLKQWVDAVLFARLETFTKVERGRAKGYSSGARVIHTQPCAAYDAGARWKLPDELPLSWGDFYGAVQAESGRAGELLEQIGKLVAELGDPAIGKMAETYAEKHKTNADRLAELVNRLSMKLEEKTKEGAK